MIDISVLVTSGCQREIALETALYYASFCKEVILIDDQQPALSIDEAHRMPGNIKYKNMLPAGQTVQAQIYNKRLVAAKNSTSDFVVHSNHDERYVPSGIDSCLALLKASRKLAFASGVAVRFGYRKPTLSYPRLMGYNNIGTANQRLRYHSKNYVPIAHYAVWKRSRLCRVLEKTIKVHEAVNENSHFDEYILELLSDLEGESRALREFYWCRNRFNENVTEIYRAPLDYHASLDVIERKLDLAFKDIPALKVESMCREMSKEYNQKPKITRRLRGIAHALWNLFIRGGRRLITPSIDDIESLLNEEGISFDRKELERVFSSFARWHQ